MTTIKKGLIQANTQLLKIVERTEDLRFKVSCQKRQTKQHLVRNIITKTTYFPSKNEEGKLI